YVVVRSNRSLSGLVPDLKGIVLGLDPKLPIEEMNSMDQLLSEELARPRFNLVLLAIFALLAVTLTAVGIYGLISYSVRQRTHEIGVRMALGAEGRDVLRLIVGQGLALALIGVAIGIVAALALTRLMTSLLYEVSATDPITFVVISLMLIGVAVGACFAPAYRATRIDPMVALRYE